MKQHSFSVGTNQASALLFLVMSVVACIPTAKADESGIRVPEGFHVELFADDELAHDIHSMTIDSQGRVVVSGPGYIRILIDADGDGKAESFQQFSDKPVTGSQGMFWLGRSLMCSGDEGLQIFRDDDRNDIADGPPEVFLRIAAGGEHHVHSIQKGPDGWWYIIAGNFAGVTSTYATMPTSPIRKPVNGTLIRLKPDLTGGEIVADGFRNAYDFAISPFGEFFTYDSDDERDISLPWYLPTRVFHVLPMSDAGWVSTGWKRPENYPDMPPVYGAFGRGSPTGVVCYQHTKFPPKYHNALFVLDWTLGRIHTVPLTIQNAVWKSEPEEFAVGQNQFGFAPTDIEVAPDGSLFVCVGGRGTRGSVFRIVWDGTEQDNDSLKSGESPQPVDQVLQAHQPLSSWSRATWAPIAVKLGAEPFRTAALEETRKVTERVRAIEILVEVFKGLDPATATKLTSAGSTLVRARTAWALGRSQPETPDLTLMKKLLADRDPFVQRVSLEALTSVTADSVYQQLTPQISAALSSESRDVRRAAAYLIARMSPDLQKNLIKLTTGNPRATIWTFLGIQLRTDQVNLDAAKFAAAVVASSEQPIELRRDALRVVQLALGDVGPAATHPPMFDSYTPRASLSRYDLELNPIRTELASVFPSGDSALDTELIRLFAMTTPLNRDLLTSILSGITDQSSPADDIHRLAALSRFELDRTADDSRAVAKSLLGIDHKIKALGLRQDTNWDDRMGELYNALCVVDPAMPSFLAEQPGLGLPGHTIYLSQIPQPLVPKVIDSFVAAIQADPDYAWSNDVVFLLGESQNPEHQQLLRSQLDNLSVRSSVLMVLAEKPVREDRPLFVSGLESTQINAVDACVTALKTLPRSNDPAEQYLLLATARRLINDTREFQIRESVIRLLQNNTGKSPAFVFGPDGHKPQPESMQAWQQVLKERFPDFVPTTADDTAKKTFEMLPKVTWENGDLERGKKLFEKLSCAKCHGGRRALGPDLTGVTKRFSRDDLFAAIVDPNRDISPRYQTTSVVTTSGKVFSGLIVYESVDGMLLRDAEHKTYRIEARDIESRHAQRASLMPAGLLKDSYPAALADLNAYLLSL
ncbi:MAG: c-type cytochrome [Planctomyces sp.]|nr:c-type cytochrome [Planctomyces sp.]